MFPYEVAALSTLETTSGIYQLNACSGRLIILEIARLHSRHIPQIVARPVAGRQCFVIRSQMVAACPIRNPVCALCRIIDAARSKLVEVFHPGINILVVSTGKRIAQCLFIDRKKRFQSHLLGGIDSIYKTEIIVVSHRHFLFLVGTLRGDKYHTCRRTGTVNPRVRPLCPAQTKFHHPVTLGCMDDDASFNTVTDSMSSGFSVSISPGTLSIKTNGASPVVPSFFPEKVAVSRIWILFPVCPGVLLPLVMVKPGMAP